MDRRSFIAGTGAFLSPLVSTALRQSTEAGQSQPPRARAMGLEARFQYLGLDPEYVYSRPSVAPDGRNILYMRAPTGGNRVLALNSDASPWSLWMVPLDGDDPELFFEREGLGATRPDWNWATGRIVFTGIRGDRAELWLLDADGGNLTHVPVGDPPRTRLFYPSWYPAGDAVAVTDYATHEILRVDVATGEAEPLTDPGLIWAGMCSVSPDSGRSNPIAFAGQPPDQSYDVRNNVLWVLTPGAPPVRVDAGRGRTPAWSPTGDRLAFSGVRGRPAPSFTLHPRTLPEGGSAVFVVRATGEGPSEERALGVTPFDVSALHPKWCPDGRTLVCMASDLDGPRAGLAVIDLEA